MAGDEARSSLGTGLWRSPLAIGGFSDGNQPWWCQACRSSLDGTGWPIRSSPIGVSGLEPLVNPGWPSPRDSGSGEDANAARSDYQTYHD